MGFGGMKCMNLFMWVFSFFVFCGRCGMLMGNVFGNLKLVVSVFGVIVRYVCYLLLLVRCCIILW